MSEQPTAWPTLEEARRWLRTGRGRGIKVAVLDSGIEVRHPALSGLKLEDDFAVVDDGVKLAAIPGNEQDIYGHGTAVAGIIRQLAPEATLGSFRVLGRQLRSRSLVIREAARLALERDYHILNCSFGCSREDHVLLYKDWIDEAYVRGRHIVAACNNQDYTQREWPGHFPTVITVNFARGNSPEEFHHRAGRMVEFEANGQDVDVAWLGGTRKRVTGSSFAAPHLTGLLARMISTLPELSPLTVKALLQQLGSHQINP